MATTTQYRYRSALLLVLANEALFAVLAGVFLLFIMPELSRFRFGRPEMAWGLVVIPFTLLFFWAAFYWRQRLLQRWGDYPLIARLIPNLSVTFPAVKFVLLRNAIFFLIVALMSPQSGSKLMEVKREGVDLMIALDLSNSMKAEDLSPNRLESAKRAISQLIEKLNQDRLGIVVFAGQPFVQLPITTDYSAAKIFLSTIDTEIMPTQGTAIGAAIELAVESFDLESPAGKAIVVISDGENHEDDALKAAREAAELGIQVHTIGMGSSQGVPIPVYRKGRKTGEYRKDQNGNAVVTQLNEQMLLDIARAGKGVYVQASNANAGLGYIFEEMAKLEKAEIDSKVFADYNDHFQYFLALALGFLILDLVFPARKPDWALHLNVLGTNSKNA
ncbi:MAG: VWA domain-containing protein [Salibacteraceae bacterium]